MGTKGTELVNAGLGVMGNGKTASNRGEQANGRNNVLAGAGACPVEYQ
jgi:hypothetical protein